MEDNSKGRVIARAKVKNVHSRPYFNPRMTAKESLAEVPEESYKRSKELSAHRSHIQLLTTLIYDNILRHKYGVAAEGLAVLARKADYIPGVLWHLGSTVLSQLSEPSEMRAQLERFFTQVYAISIPERAGIGLEKVFNYIANGDFEVGYRFLTGLMHQKPFANDPALHGYAGILASVIFLDKRQKRSRIEPEEEESQSQATWMDTQKHSEAHVNDGGSVRDRKKAMTHLRKAYMLGAREEALLCLELRLLEETDDESAMETLLLKWLNSSPDSPFVKRLWYVFLTNYAVEADEPDISAAMLSLVHLDPTDQCLANAAEVYEEGDISLATLVTVLCTRLDHSPFHQDVKLWTQLADSLEENCDEIDTLRGALEWSNRKQWWPELHIAVHPRKAMELLNARQRVFKVAETVQNQSPLEETFGPVPKTSGAGADVGAASGAVSEEGGADVSAGDS